MNKDTLAIHDGTLNWFHQVKRRTTKTTNTDVALENMEEESSKL